MKLLRLSVSILAVLPCLWAAPAQESAADLVARGQAASAQRDFEASAASFLSAVEAAPGDGEVLYSAGLGLIAAERWQEASVLLRRASLTGSASETWARIWYFALHRLNLAETDEKKADGRPFSPTGDFRAYVKTLKDDESFAANAARYALGPKRNEEFLAMAEAEKTRLLAAGESADHIDGLAFVIVGVRCEMTQLIQWAGENYRHAMSNAPLGSAPFELSRSCFARIGKRNHLTPDAYFRLEQEDRSGEMVCVTRVESEENMAFTMGLKTGERVLSIEGLPEACELAPEILGALKPGDIVMLEVEREGAPVQQPIVIDVLSFRPGQRR